LRETAARPRAEDLDEQCSSFRFLRFDRSAPPSRGAIGAAAIQGGLRCSGLLRGFAPRNDGKRPVAEITCRRCALPLRLR
jgi:hypothetical protein